MKASDYVAQELLREEVSYNARYKDQPTVLTSVRLPIEMIAWLDTLKHRGLGASRSAVIQLLCDVAIEQIVILPGLDDVELIDEVQATHQYLREQAEDSQ